MQSSSNRRLFCERVLCIRQNKLPGVAADFFFVLFLVVEGIIKTKMIVTPFAVVFEATMIIVLRRRINARTILVASSRRSSTTVLIVPTNMIRRRTMFVVMANNSAAVIVKIITIMTRINLLFRERAMFAVEQSLQEPMLMLNLFWYEAGKYNTMH